MSDLTLESLKEFILAMVAQRDADTCVIKILLSALSPIAPVSEMWSNQVSLEVVNRQLDAQTSPLGRGSMDVFNDRLNFWSRAIKHLDDGNKAAQ